MKKSKPEWALTNVPWRIKKEVWRFWALGYTVSETSRVFDLDAERYKGAPLARSTISKVRNELLKLPEALVQELVNEQPEVRGLVNAKRTTPKR